MHAGEEVNLVFVAVVLIAAAGTPPAASATPTQSSTPVEVIVVFENESAINPTIITAVGGNVTGGRNVDILPVLFARVPLQAVDPIEATPAVSYVEVDRKIDAAAQSVPWGIDRINARDAAGRINATVQANVTIAILDTGIDYDHPDLDDNVVWGVTTVGTGPIEYGKQAADDDNGHGTHAAGSAAALDNNRGVVGVAPHAELYSVKVMDANGQGTFSDLIEGLDEAIKGPDGTKGTADDADVISMSLGGSSQSQALETAVEEASQYALLIAAAGNAGDGDPTTNEVTYPANYQEVIAVAATDTSNQTPAFSSEGAEVELAAPGVDLESTYPDGQYETLSGTSMAAPHVAGTAALVIAEDLADGTRDRSNAEVRALLQETAIDIEAQGRDNTSGYGLIQADRIFSTTTVDLTVTANTTTATVDQPVQFTVRRNDTDALVNATVTINGTDYATGDDGTVTVSFDAPDTYTATATKPGTTNRTFLDDTLTVTVERRRVNLTLSANTTSIQAGDTVEFTVRRADTGDPVTAIVTINGTGYPTDENGTLVLPFDTIGTYEVTATKDATTNESFVDDSLTVTVERHQVELAVNVNVSTVYTNEPTTFTVLRTDTDAPVNATLTINDTTYRVGDDGTVTHTFGEIGKVNVTATKNATATEQFTDDTRSILVFRSRALLGTLAVSVEDADGAVKTPVTVKADGTVVEEGTTGSDGTVRFDLQPNQYTIRVRGDIAHITRTVVVRSEETTATSLAFGNLLVRVTGADGPISNAAVDISSDRWAVTRFQTKWDGTVRLTLAPGSYGVKVYTDSVLGNNVSVAAGEETTTTFTFGTLTVLARSSAGPIDDAEITIRSDGEFVTSGTTHEGRQSFRLPSGSYTVAVAADNTVTETFRVRAGEDRLRIIEFSTLTVNAEATAGPIDGANVTIASNGTVHAERPTSSNGRATFTLAPGAYTIDVRADSTVRTTVETTADARTTATAAFGTLVVTAISKRGHGVRNATVTIRSDGTLQAQQHTDRRGLTSFVLAPGDYRIEISHNNTTLKIDAPVAATAETRVEGNLSSGDFSVDDPIAHHIEIDNQTFTNGADQLTVANATYTGGDFAVAIHNASAPGDPLIGRTTLDRGINTRVTVALDEPITRNITVTATLHTANADAPITDGKSVTDTAIITITPAANVVDQYDANGDGDINLKEAQTAIQDWAAGQLPLSEVQTIIQAWATD